MKRRITKTLLVFLAVAAIFMAGFQVMNSYTNFKALPVTSDFMEPAIFRGSLMFMEKTPEKDLKPGDIIAVGLPNNQSTALGRLIQSNQMADDYYNLTFKGDHRTLPEDFPYTVKDATYLNRLSIPLLGYLVVFLSSPFGLILFTASSIYFAWLYLFKMHDRLSWAERNAKRVSYHRRVAMESAEDRKKYNELEDFFTVEADEPNDFANSDNEPNDEPSKVEEQTR